MGCICSKGTRTIDVVSSNRVKDRSSANASKKLSVPSRKDDRVVEEETDVGGNDATARLISNHTGNLACTPVSSEEEEKKWVVAAIERKTSASQFTRKTIPEVKENVGAGQPRTSRLTSIPNGERGAQIIAGWPSWLSAVAGEAINGWIPRKAESFEKMEKIGQGTYSSVYKARDLETNKIVALKKVRFANMDPESVRFMAREIIILRRLDHPNAMKLEGLITSKVSGSLYLVFEYMDHDLSGLASAAGTKFSESQIKCYMKQLFHGLQHCHSRGVLHRDIKGSNLLIDQNNILKIGDFGLATIVRPQKRQPLTSRVVTLWYRPPELLLGSTDYGLSVDLWSAGCILAELFMGKPIMPGRTEVEQLHKIFKLCGSPSEEYWKRSKLPHATIFKPQQPYNCCIADTFKDIPSSALSLLKVLLAVEPESRGTASSALQSEFFTTSPLPCEPSSLPKYRPSKELDAKNRLEEAARRKAAGAKGRVELKRGVRESKAVPAPNANAELQASIMKRIGQSNPKSVSEKFNPEEDSGSGFRIEPRKGARQNTHSVSSELMHPTTFESSSDTKASDDFGSQTFGSTGRDLREQRSYVNRGATELSRFSNSVAVRRSSHFENKRDTSTANRHWPEERFNGKHNQFNGGESSEKYDWSRSLLDKPKYSHKKDEQQSEKESVVGFARKTNRIHYSGPLLPSGGNLDEMLKEHERQIQQAVRKARTGKTETGKADNHDNGVTESLLQYGGSGS